MPRVYQNVIVVNFTEMIDEVRAVEHAVYAFMSRENAGVEDKRADWHLHAAQLRRKLSD